MTHTFFPASNPEIGGCALCQRAPECRPGARICRDCIVVAGVIYDVVTDRAEHDRARSNLLGELLSLVAESLIAEERGHKWTSSQRDRCRAILVGSAFEVVGEGTSAEYKNSPASRRL